MKNFSHFQDLLKEGIKITKNASSFAAKLPSELVSGKKIISPAELSAERLNICKNCQSLDKKYIRCLECGCFLLAKTKISFEECPLGKW